MDSHINGQVDFRSTFLDELLSIVEDPQVRAFARRRAGSREIAEDALQETYYALARLRDPTKVADLRAYFFQTLIREMARQQRALGVTLVENFDQLRESAAKPWISSFEDHLLLDIRAEEWFALLNTRREDLLGAIPGRSSVPRAYKVSIFNCAVKVLELAFEGSVEAADWKNILISELPEWIRETGLSADATHQRMSRARKDIQEVLRSLVQREELAA